MRNKDTNEEKGDSLFRVDRLELYGLISVLPPARRASAIEVLLDVVPAELADLQRAAPHVSDGSSSELGPAEARTW